MIRPQSIKPAANRQNPAPQSRRQHAGYDMHDQADVHRFMLEYNRNIDRGESPEDMWAPSSEVIRPRSASKDAKKKKAKRKMAWASRKKNKKKR